MSEYLDKIDAYVRGASVAVVGNAASLFSASHGREIDSHDIVIRFGKGAPDLFNAVHVGTRTDIWSATAFRFSVPTRDVMRPKYSLLSLAQLGLYNDPPKVLLPDCCMTGDLTEGEDYAIMGDAQQHLSWAAEVGAMVGRPSQGALFVAFMKQRGWAQLARNIKFFGFDFFGGTFDMKGKPTASWHCPIMRDVVTKIPHDAKAEAKFIKTYIQSHANIDCQIDTKIEADVANGIIKNYRGKSKL